MQDLLKSLVGMSPRDLVCNAKRLGTRLARGEWELAGHLLAIERTKAYLAAGYTSTVAFAEGVLALDAFKAVELLRVARLLESYPRLSAAFADGRLAWSKLREVSRVVTPESENEWLQFALTHSAADVQRRVVRSPRRQRLEQRQPVTGSQKAEQAEFDTPSGAGVLEAVASPAPGSEPTPPALCRPSPVSTTEAPPPFPEMSRPPEAAATAVIPTDAPATSPLVRITLTFTADEYAEFEKAMEQVQSRLGRKQRRERLVLELARGARGKAAPPRHMVLIHVDAKTGAGWYETERGAVPAEPAVVESAVAEGRVAIVQDEPTCGFERTCGLDNAVPQNAAASCMEKPPAQTPRRPRGTRRKRLSVALVEAVYARARGKCERCGRGGVLHIHHHRPWSENGEDSLLNLRLFCSDCHVAHHERDYREKPRWRERRAFRTDARSATVAVVTGVGGGP